jgi:hypothetical protein
MRGYLRRLPGSGRYLAVRQARRGTPRPAAALRIPRACSRRLDCTGFHRLPVHGPGSVIIATPRNAPLTCNVSEPPIGIEPMTYALRGGLRLSTAVHQRHRGLATILLLAADSTRIQARPGSLLALALATSLRPTVRFSGVADAQLMLDVREYVAVHRCVRALTAADVAVTAAVGDTSGPSASGAGSQARAFTPLASPMLDSLALASSSRSQLPM